MPSISLDQLISQYGYLAVGVGGFFESNAVLIMGGISAHQAYLKLPYVLLSAFVGASLGNQLFFMVGRAKGQPLIQNRPKWKSKSDTMSQLLNRHELRLLLGYRFVPGLSMVTPFLLGATGFSPSRFFSLNLIGALIWSFVYSVLGSGFGKTLELVIGDFHHHELKIFALIILLALLLLGNMLRKNKK